jgi:hypothetical protein
MSHPAFYQLMNRLEKAKLVNGRYRKKRVKDQEYRERFYLATVPAIKALIEFRRFAAATYSLIGKK